MIDPKEMNRRRREELCVRCGGPVPEATGYRPRKYCSEACSRQAARARARWKYYHPSDHARAELAGGKRSGGEVVATCTVGDCGRPLRGPAPYCYRHSRRVTLTGSAIVHCSVEECEREAYQLWGSGYCKSHHDKWRKHGDPLHVRQVRTGCKVEGCERKHFGEGYCQMHLRRFRQHGDPLYVRPERLCSIEGCERKHAAHGYCSLHDWRYLHHGDPLAQVRERKHGPPLSYGAAHNRVRSVRGIAPEHPCSECGEPAEEWAYDHGDPAELTATRVRDGRQWESPYSTDPDHYRAMCRSCHRQFDLASRAAH